MAPPGAVVLVFNIGSSSIKFATFSTGQEPLPLAGKIDGIGNAPCLTLKAGGNWGQPEGKTHDALLQWLLPRLEAHLTAGRIVGVGHRVVHGGMAFAEPVRLTPDVMTALDALIPLAPQHQPHNLAGIAAVAQLWPQVPQVACFDTAFHRTQPEEAQLFALPRSLTGQGIRRYGFHGLSYDYIAGILPDQLPAAKRRRVIVAHLGHGASLCALLDGRSIATTMGFTALDGLVMGTRSGNIDPGVLLHLIEQMGWSARQVSDLLYNRSGLLGVSGLSDDMRTLLASDSDAARQAVGLFTYRIAWETGALISVLGGLDAFVFTAGIGEHAAAVRAEVCRRLAWAGLEVDETANKAGGPGIAARASRVAILALPTNEEKVIARHTAQLIQSAD